MLLAGGHDRDVEGAKPVWRTMKEEIAVVCPKDLGNIGLGEVLGKQPVRCGCVDEQWAFVWRQRLYERDKGTLRAQLVGIMLELGGDMLDQELAATVGRLERIMVAGCENRHMC